MSKYFEDNIPEKPMTFHVVELDVSDIWVDHRPCDDDNAHELYGPEATNETRNYVELAGGQLLAWFIVDPRLVSGELVHKRYSQIPGKTCYAKRGNAGIPFEGKIPLWLVGHLPKNPVTDAGHLLGEALHIEGCEGYGYIPITKTREEVSKLRVVRTIEALDPDEAGYEVREEAEAKHNAALGYGPDDDGEAFLW